VTDCYLEIGRERAVSMEGLGKHVCPSDCVVKLIRNACIICTECVK
jgi:hypothetical protein